MRCISSGVRICAGICRPRAAVRISATWAPLRTSGGQPVILACVRPGALGQDLGRDRCDVVAGDPADLLVTHRPHHLAVAQAVDGQQAPSQPQLRCGRWPRGPGPAGCRGSPSISPPHLTKELQIARLTGAVDPAPHPLRVNVHTRLGPVARPVRGRGRRAPHWRGQGHQPEDAALDIEVGQLIGPPADGNDAGGQAGGRQGVHAP
jgi:hypothetical protein